MIPVSRETEARLAAYAGLVRAENTRQNLVSRSTLDMFRSRHIDDSLQLLPLARDGLWIDIGSGAGLPGLVVAIAEPDRPVLLVEPRAKRAAFLQDVVDELALKNVEVIAAKVEQLRDYSATVISARAVAPLGTLLGWAVHLANPSTVWLLPKGRSAASELESIRATWQGDFRLIASVTDSDAGIIAATGVRQRGKTR